MPDDQPVDIMRPRDQRIGRISAAAARAKPLITSGKAKRGNGRKYDAKCADLVPQNLIS